MPRFGNARPPAVAGLLTAAVVLAFATAQQLGGPTAIAESERTADTHAFQPLVVAAVPQPARLSVNAAVSVGQFEELVRPTALPTVAPTAMPAPTVAPTAVPTPAAKVFETGVASTYGEGDGFEGNRTACGQIFRTAIVQVAHKSLPCGTIIRIEDTDTGSSVVAEVTDRGPYIPGRIVDLSWGAFKQLDETAPGLLHVNVYLVEP